MRCVLIGQLCCDVAVLPLHCVVVVMSCTGVMLSWVVLCCGCALAGGSLNSRPTSAAPRSPAPRPVAPAQRLSSAWIRPPRPSPSPTRARAAERAREEFTSLAYVFLSHTFEMERQHNVHEGGDVCSFSAYTSDGLAGRGGDEDEESSQSNSPSDLRGSGRMFIPSPGSAAAGATLGVSAMCYATRTSHACTGTRARIVDQRYERIKNLLNPRCGVAALLRLGLTPTPR